MGITVQDLLEQWYERNRIDLATTSRGTTENAMKILIKDFGPISVDTIRPRDIDDWHATRRAQGYSRGYNVRISGVLSTACGWGIRRDICETNPVALARQKREKGKKVKSPTPDLVQAALVLAKKIDPVGFLFVRLDTIIGARRSEVLGFARPEFDPDMRTLVIRRRVVPCKGGLAIQELTKSDHSARVVSIDAHTCELIEKALTTHSSPWLFPGRDPSRPMHPTSMSHKISRLGRKLDAHLHCHCFRHYCATQSLAAGIPLPIVAARLGDSVATVVKIYAHSLRPDDRGAADAMAASIS